MGIAADDIDQVSAKLEASRDADAILLSGGSSKGQSDFVTRAIERLGGVLLLHGINVKPGKPTIFGSLWDKPVFGLPGHPVSCSLIVLRFVLPLLTVLSGEKRAPWPGIVAKLDVNVPSSHGIEEYVRVRLSQLDGAHLATPLFAKSSVISMLAAADGYIVVPEGREGLEQGEDVEVHSLG
jgi:molybdopterin molybdotransferase